MFDLGLSRETLEDISSRYRALQANYSTVSEGTMAITRSCL